MSETLFLTPGDRGWATSARPGTWPWTSIGPLMIALASGRSPPAPIGVVILSVSVRHALVDEARQGPQRPEEHLLCEVLRLGRIGRITCERAVDLTPVLKAQPLDRPAVTGCGPPDQRGLVVEGPGGAFDIAVVR